VDPHDVNTKQHRSVSKLRGSKPRGCQECGECVFSRNYTGYKCERVRLVRHMLQVGVSFGGVESRLASRLDHASTSIPSHAKPPQANK